jgi:hypothetical protein
VDTEADVIDALEKVVEDGANECILIFSNPEVPHGLTCDGIPQVNLDQMNPRRMMDPSFCTLAMEAQKERGEFIPDRPYNGLLMVVDCGGGPELQDPRDEAHSWEAYTWRELARVA